MMIRRATLELLTLKCVDQRAAGIWMNPEQLTRSRREGYRARRGEGQPTAASHGVVERGLRDGDRDIQRRWERQLSPHFHPADLPLGTHAVAPCDDERAKGCVRAGMAARVEPQEHLALAQVVNA